MPGPCDVPVIGGVCDMVGNAASAVATNIFESIAETAGEWAGQMLVNAMTWWVQTPSVNPNTNAVRTAQEWTLPIVAFVLVGSVLWQCGRMILSRKKDPLLNIGAGLIRYTVITTIGLIVLAGAIKAGDALAQAMIQDTALKFANRMKDMLTLAILANPFGLLIIGLLLGLVALFQWVIGFLRQAGILILAAMIPLAASGSLNESTKAWWPKLATSALALVAYKPAAAFIYMIGFTFMGSKQSFTTVMVGAMVLFLSLFALPALLKFFSWAEQQVSGSGSGGGSAFAGALGAMAASGGSGGGSGGGSSSSSASAMQSTGPGSQDSGAGSFGAIPGADGGPSGGGQGAGMGQGPTSGAGSFGSEPGMAGGSGGGGSGAIQSSGGTEAAVASGGTTAAVGAGIQVAQSVQQGAQQAAGEMSSTSEPGESSQEGPQR